MKYIKLDNDFDIDRVKQPDVANNQELTCIWLRAGVIAGYPILTSDKRRLLISLSNRLAQAVKDKVEYFEINPVEEKFMRDGFEKSTTKPETAQYIQIAEDALFNAVDTIPQP